MKIGLGCDHAGYRLKEAIKLYLTENQLETTDFGTFSEDSTDYTVFAHAVANAINRNELEVGILICGSGNGVNMTANKYPNVRSALCWDKEVAYMARLHNNANILALPARYISIEVALECVKVFLSTPFEGGRHELRVSRISKIG